ncbi:UNVERIFIED_CONTAM: hypothetical protein PYX00_002179 [Menopon gallinae]|uniref:Very-long-chain (3R)-3-hydroxyacyl-CoA dehydratase n=1 Tax=Menopon gallinae TaxID=328185 RepID=A0AAW2IHY2_9NEOP
MTAKSSNKNPSKSEPSVVSKAYLVAYNFIQVIGWSWLLYLIIQYYLKPKTEGVKDTLWPHVSTVTTIFQNAAALEIIHAATGLVPSSAIVTTLQVLSRLMVVDGVLLATPTGPLSPGLPLCLIAWAITEIIRYLYYALNIINTIPDFLTWCRYTFFIVLYPLGVTGELLCFYWAQAYVKEHKIYTVELPNSMNFTFSYHYFMVMVMLLYIPSKYFHDIVRNIAAFLIFTELPDFTESFAKTGFGKPE